MKQHGTTMRKVKAYGYFLIGSLALFGLNACEYPNKQSVSPKDQPPAFDQHFNFATTTDVKIHLTAKDGKGQVLKMTNIQIFDKDPDQGGQLLFRGGVDANGKLSSLIALPAYLTEVYVMANYPGVLGHVILPVSNNSITYTFSPVAGETNARVNANTNARISSGKFSFLGTFSNLGVPTYLEPINDVIDAALLDAINASLPEKKYVNAAYLAPGVSRDIMVVKDSYISITFIGEGAKYRNAMGYYTYPLNNPPNSPEEISKKMIVFPNASFLNDGGGLVAGNKVKLPGPIPAGTGIGFFIVADGWTGSTISESSTVLYSNPAFNPGSNPSLKQHSVLLNNQGKYILGFEDQRRDMGSDHDFNDVIFCVTTDTPGSVDDDDIPSVETPKDCDKDGVPDVDDQYPCDPVRAYNNKTVGTLAFEDLWPNKGDFDMNDLVLNYQHNLVTNSSNQVVELISDFDILAIGARYKNGFGFEMSQLSPSKIASVNSTYSGTVLEQGQAKATILVFDNAFEFAQGHDAMVNTYMALAKVACQRITVTTTFTAPLTMEEVGTAPFNPFLICNQKREYEVHLPGYTPTSKADISLLGTKDDASKPSQGVYYKTHEGMPFALHLPIGQFQYPVEMSRIDLAYLKFAPWASSNGAQYADWYLDLPDYRDKTKIYTK